MRQAGLELNPNPDAKSIEAALHPDVPASKISRDGTEPIDVLSETMNVEGINDGASIPLICQTSGKVIHDGPVPDDAKKGLGASLQFPCKDVSQAYNEVFSRRIVESAADDELVFQAESAAPFGAQLGFDRVGYDRVGSAPDGFQPNIFAINGESSAFDKTPG